MDMLKNYSIFIWFRTVNCNWRRWL